jgi:hypothetical protein
MSTLSVSNVSDGTTTVGTSYVVNGSARAWAHVNAGNAAISDSLNISSIDDDGTGEFGLNYTNAMNSSTYCATATITFSHDHSVQAQRILTIESKGTSSVEVDAGYINSVGDNLSLDIGTDGSVLIHGDLA